MRSPAAKLLIGVCCAIDGRSNEGTTPLSLAASSGSFRVAELLVTHGASVNMKDNFGGSPLMYTALMDHDNIAKLLIRNGADIESALCSAGPLFILQRQEIRQQPPKRLLKRRWQGRCAAQTKNAADPRCTLQLIAET